MNSSYWYWYSSNESSADDNELNIFVVVLLVLSGASDLSVREYLNYDVSRVLIKRKRMLRGIRVEGYGDMDIVV